MQGFPQYAPVKAGVVVRYAKEQQPISLLKAQPMTTGRWFRLKRL